MNYHVASASTRLVLSMKKIKLINFRWEYMLSLEAVLKQEILMLFQTIFIHLPSNSPEQAGLPRDRLYWAVIRRDGTTAPVEHVVSSLSAGFVLPQQTVGSNKAPGDKGLAQEYTTLDQKTVDQRIDTHVVKASVSRPS